MALIVIEGPDGAGKSTLIERLRGNSTRYFAILRASGPPIQPDGKPSRGFEFMEAARVFAESLAPFPVICDRIHAISENIYGPLLRGIAPESHPMILDRLYPVQLLIYCRPPTSIILDNLKKPAEQMKGVNEKAGDIIAAYDALMDGLSYRRGMLRYDYTTDSIEKIRDLLSFE